jgi:hypothetical protein
MVCILFTVRHTDVYDIQVCHNIGRVGLYRAALPINERGMK